MDCSFMFFYESGLARFSCNSSSSSVDSIDKVASVLILVLYDPNGMDMIKLAN